MLGGEGLVHTGCEVPEEVGLTGLCIFVSCLNCVSFSTWRVSQAGMKGDVHWSTQCPLFSAL